MQILFPVVEFLLIPAYLIYALGVKLAIAILLVFFMLVRPALGAQQYTMAATIGDNLFTLGIAALAFSRGNWVIGSILIIYEVINLSATRIVNVDPF